MSIKLFKRITTLTFVSVLLLLTIFQMFIVPARAPSFDSDVTIIPSSPSQVDEVNVTVVFHFTSSPPGAKFGNLTKVGNTFSVNVTVHDTTGYRLFILHDDKHTYHLGKLHAGSYQFKVYVEYRLDDIPILHWLKHSISFTVRINVPSDYPTIQEAINAANSGDTIFVSSGIYYEHVVVNKAISLIGENKSTTIIDGNGTGEVVSVEADNVSIGGFTIRNGWDGVFLSGVNNTVVGNTVSNNGRGIRIGAESSYSNVSSNIISNNTKEGIDMGGGNGANNAIISNTISYNGLAICLRGSYTGADVLRENQMIGNRYGLEIYDDHKYGFTPYSDVDTSNTVDGKPVYYLVNQSNLVIDPSTFPEIGYLGIAYSTNVTVRDLSISKSGQGICFSDSDNIRIENVTVTNNAIGIDLAACGWNSYEDSILDSKILNNEVGISFLCGSGIIVKNNLVSNNSVGIEFYGMSGGNVIFDNTISNNSGNGIQSGTEIYLFNINVGTISCNTISNNGKYGIYIFDRGGNTIRGNTISNNKEYGIYLNYQQYLHNNIYYNNFINNTNQIYQYPNQTSQDDPNIWDDGHGIGNYWSDYNGTDLDGDGIGNTNLPWQKVDDYPLMNPWRALCQFSYPENIPMFQVHLEVDTYFPRGFYLVVKFYSYGGLYQGNVTVWNGTTSAYVNLSMNVSHPLNLPVENATLVLTDEAGTILKTVITFTVRRTHLFDRIREKVIIWPFAPFGERIKLFKQIVDISKQWPYAPP